MRLIHKINKYLFSQAENFSGKFLTFHSRPILAAQVGTWPDKLAVSPKFAVVIQGPIIRQRDFTLETIRLYKKHFHPAIIILSTWDDEDPAYLYKIRAENIEILLNPKPAFAGIANINFQITSAGAGVRRAKELGAEYVLKTRTDQRIYAPNAKEFLCNLLAGFPPAPGFNQRGRITGVSLNTFKYRLYGLSDMNVFGYTDDMLLYWGADLQSKSFVEDIGGPLKTAPGLYYPESYLAAAFLEKIGRKLKWTMQDSWQAFAQNFCVIDQHCLDLYWHKYGRYKEYRHLGYGAIRSDRELNFLEWFNLYQGLGNKQDTEKVVFSSDLNPR